jgi:hypothetical protein
MNVMDKEGIARVIQVKPFSEEEILKEWHV